MRRRRLPGSVLERRPRGREAAQPGLADDAAFRSRFERELRVAQGGAAPTPGFDPRRGEADGRPYLVLEYVTAGSLATSLRARPLRSPGSCGSSPRWVRARRASPARTRAPRRQALQHHAPRRRLGRADRLRARQGAGYTVLTRPGQVLGTLDYLAPELVRGEEATAASDVYALGCVAFECLAGKPPFADRSLFGVGTAHLEDEPPDPPAPPDVAWALLRALAKDACGRGRPRRRRMPTCFAPPQGSDLRVRVA